MRRERTEAAKKRATQMAAVLIHYAKGGSVEAMEYANPMSGYTETDDCPVNWAKFHYRIMKEGKNRR